MEEYLDANFAYLNFDLDYGSTPKFYDVLYGGHLFEPAYHMLEGSIDYAINGHYDYNPDTLKCQFINGIYEPNNYGDLICFDDQWYRYIASMPCSCEMEHQAQDGGLAYEYRGESFVRILEPISETLQDEYPTQNGSVSLIEQIL